MCVSNRSKTMTSIVVLYGIWVAGMCTFVATQLIEHCLCLHIGKMARAVMRKLRILAKVSNLRH